MKRKITYQSVTKKVLVMLSLSLIISSCQQDEIDPASVGETAIAIKHQTPKEVFGEEVDRLKDIALSGNYKVPIQEAEEIAMETATQMRELEGILTKSSLVISSVEKIIGDKKEQVIDTKSEEEVHETTVSDMYLFNFENDQGYVLMSGDKRATGVLAYSSQGHLGDSISNPGQAILLERSTYYIEKKRKEFESMKQELIVEAEEDMFQNLPKEEQDSLISEGLFDENGKRVITKAYEGSCDSEYMPHMKGLQNESEKCPKKRCRWGSFC